jgi:hypothetical protein
MLRFNIKFDKFEYNPKLAANAWDAWMKYEIKEAARVFFKTALPLIHVDTGMAIASMTNLALFLQEPLVFANRIKRGAQLGGYRPPDSDTVLDRSIGNGILMGCPLNEIIRKTGSGQYIFKYWTEVWHFVLWDTVGLNLGKGGPRGSPWKAFETGQEAALRYLSTAGDRMPALDSLMSITEVAIQIQEGVTRTQFKRRRNTESRNLFDALPGD